MSVMLLGCCLLQEALVTWPPGTPGGQVT